MDRRLHRTSLSISSTGEATKEVILTAALVRSTRVADVGGSLSCLSQANYGLTNLFRHVLSSVRFILRERMDFTSKVRRI